MCWAFRVGLWLDEQKIGSESYFSGLNVLNNITANIATCMRTQTLITGKNSKIEEAIEAAMMYYKDRWKKV